jgi:signal peptidase I
MKPLANPEEQLIEVPADAAPAPATVATPPVPPEKESTTSVVLDSVQFLASTIVIAIFVIVFLTQAFQIPSESMEDTLLVGDYLLVDKVYYGSGGIWGSILPYHQVRRGDIVVFKWPVKPQQHFVKRVLAVPGDRIRLTHGRVFVNGERIEEKYAIFRAHAPDTYRDEFPNIRFPGRQVTRDWWESFPGFVRNGDLLVPEGHYFVLGDNRDQSLDSRYWGFVPRENIVGKPLLIYLSLQPTLQEIPANAVNDKIGRFGYVLGNLPGLARWNRMLRVVP